MSVKDTHARVKANIWQAIAQSDIDTSSIEKETLDQLVALATEAALLEVDTTLEASLVEEQSVEGIKTSILDDHKEDILWEGRPFLSLVHHYTITDERIRMTEGMLGKTHENVELVRIQDLDYSQTFSERLLNLGDIKIRSHDPSHPIIVLRNVQDPEAVYEILRRAVLHARKKHGFTYREEM